VEVDKMIDFLIVHSFAMFVVVLLHLFWLQVDWKRAQEVRLLWEKRMRHVSRGQQLYNNNNHHHHHSFHKRPSDIPEGAEDATEGSSKDFLSDKKKTKTQKTFKRHHGWMTPVS